jgi:threonine/homoserine/homoserine lactone efflux protein
MSEINYSLIILAALITIASPGPGTLAIAGASMSQGRHSGLSTAAGVFIGALILSCAAAFGLAAIIHSTAWLADLIRYLGASYLIFLAYKSLKSARSCKQLDIVLNPNTKFLNHFVRGLFIPLTNPKAILFFASLYSIGLPNQVSTSALMSVIFAVASVNFVVFLSYAVLFSNMKMRFFYLKSKSLFEYLFAAFFGLAGIKILTSSI